MQHNYPVLEPSKELCSVVQLITYDDACVIDSHKLSS